MSLSTNRLISISVLAGLVDEVAAVEIGVFREGVDVGRVHGPLDDVAEVGAGLAQDITDIGEAFRNLRAHVAGSNQVAVRIACRDAGREEHPPLGDDALRECDFVDPWLVDGDDGAWHAGGTPVLIIQ